MTDRYAVIGNPIGHSKSPLIHSTFAASCGQEIDYQALEGPLTPGGFADTALAFRARGGRGVNITAPFKLDAHALATSHSERAKLAGAANCLRFGDGDLIEAENFDGIGLLRDIEVNLDQALAGQRVLLLGAGGAARGAVLPFAQARPAKLVLVNRTISKAETLARLVAGTGTPVRACGYAALSGNNERFDIVVNATSASMRGELPPVPAGALADAKLAYELVYGKGLTPFLQRARDSGAAQLADGVGMLVEQAAEAFAWWRGVRPDTGPVIRRLTIPLT